MRKGLVGSERLAALLLELLYESADSLVEFFVGLRTLGA